MNTKQVGDASEAAVLAALVDRGYAVSVPFGDNDPYDLVVDDGATLFRVQVKTGWLEDGCIRFKTASKTTTDGSRVVRDYTASEIDGFAVRSQETDELYWVPIEDAGRKHTYLRVSPAAIDRPSVRNAATYALSRQFPRLDE